MAYLCSPLRWLFLSFAFASLPLGASEWKDRRAQLDQCHIQAPFRLFYTLTGPDALPSAARIDTNTNLIPDAIDRVADQLHRARRMFHERWGLVPPLDGDRFRPHARSIDVHVLQHPTRPGGPRNGTAYDAWHSIDRTSSGQVTQPALVIDVSTTLSPTNLTPAHELFHLYQYGYTYFKNGWFLEGTARWVEDAFRPVAATRLDPLPKTRADLQALFAKRYDAVDTWRALGLVARPPSFRSGPEDSFPDAAFLKNLLEALARQDDHAATAFGLPPGEWPEARQTDAANHPWMWQAVKETVGNAGGLELPDLEETN